MFYEVTVERTQRTTVRIPVTMTEADRVEMGLANIRSGGFPVEAVLAQGRPVDDWFDGRARVVQARAVIE